jgi:hypothetical protein
MREEALVASPLNPVLSVGVLSDDELLFVDTVQGKPVWRTLLVPLNALEGPEGLLAFLWETGLERFWVMPASRFSQSSAWFEAARNRWSILSRAGVDKPGRAARILFLPKDNGPRQTRQLVLLFPEYAGWDWKLSNMHSLLATVSYLEQVLERPLADASEQVARQLLSDLTRDGPLAAFRASAGNAGTLCDREGNPIPLWEYMRDMAWMRPLNRGEQRGRYLHKYTHLSLSLQAALRVLLGGGAAQHSVNGRAYDGARPGIWRVHAEAAGSVFNGKQLPGMLLEQPWRSTPQVACCQEIGYHTQISEGWYWQESYPLLQTWAARLWQAAERLHTNSQRYRHVEARNNAFSAITRLAQLGIDLIGQTREAGGWGRPDWWAQLVGGGQAQFFRQLVQLVRKGIMPVLVVGNAFWLVSDEANPTAAAPLLFSSRRWSGYMVGYQTPLPLSNVVKEAFQKAEQAGELGKRLDALASGDNN